MESIRLASALLIIAFAAGCAPSRSHAEESPPTSPGIAEASTHVYVTKGGWGELQLFKTAESDMLNFDLKSESLGYECRMNGTTTTNLQATQVAPAPGAGDCKVTMQRTERGIEVDTSTPEACVAYCGRNGSFRGLYLAVDPQCAPGNLHATLQQVANDKDRSGILKTMANRCADTLPFSSAAVLHLELATDYDRKGDAANCLLALSPYSADAARSDDEITQGMTGSAAEEITGILDVVRSMMDRCKRKLPPGSVGRPATVP